MTRWRGPYLSARIIPLTVSLAIGLVTNALLPGFAVGWLVGGTVAILLRLRCGWWRAGARRPTPDEVAILRSTSGLIPHCGVGGNRLGGSARRAHARYGCPIRATSW